MLEEMFKKLEDTRNAEKAPFLGDAAEQAAFMRAKYALLTQNDDLKPGDVVVWKAGLKNIRWPAEGEPVIVTGVNPGAVDPEESAGSSSYLRPSDLRILIRNSEGDLNEFWVDARRFERYEDAE